MVNPRDLMNVTIFRGLNEEELESVAKVCKEEKFRKDEIVIYQGDSKESLNILIKGVLEVEAEIPGFEGIIKICSLNPKEIFGELSFIDNASCSTNVKCSEDAVIITLDRANFNELIKDNPRIELIVLRNLAVLLSQKIRNTTVGLREGISRLPSRVVSGKARSIFLELSEWIHEIDPRLLFS